jgi:hypothetical protein
MGFNALAMEALGNETVVHTVTFFGVGIDTNQNLIILLEAISNRHTSGVNFGHWSDTIIILMECIGWFLTRWWLLNSKIQFKVSIKWILFDYAIVINGLFYANSIGIARFTHFGSLD